MELIYNLPGFKEVKIKLFKTSGNVYSLLNEYFLIDKLKNIAQLGSIRFAFPGLHHTRYEYVILQLYFIQLLGQNRNKLEYLPTTSNVNFNEIIQFFGSEFKEVSNVRFSCIEFLQILVLLSNIGHFPETFAASKTFLNILKTDKNLLQIYKRGIGKNGQKSLKRILELENFYEIHLLNSIFILRRLKRKSKKLSLLSELIVLSYLNREQFSDKEIIFKTFRKLRDVAFLILDSQYSLVPFYIDLNLISDDFVDFYHKLMEDNSPTNSSVYKLIQILEQSLYFLPKSMKSVYATYECLSVKSEDLIGVSSIKELKELFLFEDYPKYNISTKCKEQEIEKFVELKVSIEDCVFYIIDSEIFKNVNNKIKNLNKRFFPIVIILPNANFSKLYIMLSLNKENLENKKVITIFKELLNFSSKLPLMENNKIGENILLDLILKGTLYYSFNLDTDNIKVKTNKKDFIFSTPNKAKIELENKSKETRDQSQRNEIEMIKECIDNEYENRKRKILIYFGSLKIREKINNNWNDKAEIDGIILDFYEKSIILIEAKKEYGGTAYSESKRALKEKLRNLDINYNENDIKSLSKGAYIKLKMLN